MTHTLGSSLHIGKRIGEADCSAGNGSGYIKEWDTESIAAAFVRPNVSLKRRHELFTPGMVLHCGWVGLGIRQDVASGIDNGGASPGGQGFLSRDLCQRMASIDVYAMCEQDSFLGKVALDLLP